MGMTNDFDFFVGRWNVNHRRLLHPLTGSDEWDLFGATTVARTYFGGGISVDEIAMPERQFSGLSLRLFDPHTRNWTVYWVNSRDGRLQPPVRGRWVDGVSRLYGDDTHEGKPVRATYQWSDVTPSSARWEQAFSTDGEQTWETNWIMDFTRTAADPVDEPATHLPKLTGDFDFLAGNWTLRNRRLKEWLTGCDEWVEFEHTAVGRTHFNGVVSIDENTYPTRGHLGLAFRLYDVAAQEWSIYWVDSRDNRLGPPVVGVFRDGVGEFYGDDEHEGTPVRVRFLWTDITAEGAHWEQAFSVDGGQTWETNWVNDLVRR